MRKNVIWPGAMALVGLLLVTPSVSAQQLLNVSIGAFTVRGEDGRLADDVLLENRSVFLFDIEDFNSASVGLEWVAPLGRFLEAGAGVAYTGRTVDTIYARFTRPGGAEIEQSLKLRIVPLTATLRILPLGREAPVQPYVGGGIGVLNWRYSETGDFIDFTTPRREIFRDTFVASGTAVGPVAVFGLRVPMGSFAAGAEVRYQKADGDLNDDFLAPKVDLGGLHWVATFGVRF
ncbi:MAG: hypothetical protein AB1635_02435 [Acidobacteriota bacterium]